MVQTKLCDLIACLKLGVKIEFDLSSYEHQMKFVGTLNKFLESIHYRAFCDKDVISFYITGNFLDGYIAHIRMLPPLID